MNTLQAYAIALQGFGAGSWQVSLQGLVAEQVLDEEGGSSRQGGGSRAATNYRIRKRRRREDEDVLLLI